MRQYIPVITLAAALALLLGVLLPSDNVVFAVAPVFDTGTDSRSVDENTPPGTNIGAPISATDPDETGENALEFGNTLIYSLEVTDAALFDIDSSTGQLITKAPLDAEAAASHTVTVRVDDGEDETNVTRNVVITVNDVNEPPAALAPPTVVSGRDDDISDEDEVSTTSLRVVWHPPVNTGRPDIGGYDVEYKKSTDTTFGSSNVNENGTTADITVLEADTAYDVRVRATNNDLSNNNGTWSLVGTGSTNKEGNSPPRLTEEPVTRSVLENTSAGENVGNPVTAADGDSTTLTYRLEGPDAGLFSFNTRTGQIRTKAPLNHEDPRCYNDTANPTTCTYRVTVIVTDGAGGSDAAGVNIQVGDKFEEPSAPARPTVRATEKSSTSLDVSWSAPQNTGPDIVSYEVQWRKGSEAFSDDNCVSEAADNCREIAGTKVTIVMLEDDTTYEVRVKADNGERASAWSASGSGRTNRANHDPIFDDRPGTGDTSVRASDLTIWRAIDENPRSGQVVGRVVADDEDNDRLSYKLVESADTDEARGELSKFTINETTGEIRTKAGESYSYEDIDASGTCGDLDSADIGSDRCYTVKVEVRDRLDINRTEAKDEVADDTITLKVVVRNRDEPPATPTVMVTSPDDETTLEVIWHAENTGPAIDGYDVQYRKGSGSFSDVNCNPAGANGDCNGISGTTTTISMLDADTSYSVQVRARNGEGTSAWSPSVTVKTNETDNAPPTFIDSASPLGLSVAESTLSTQSARDVDNPVRAEDTVTTSLTYRHDGPDKALFTIVSSTGQIRTRSALSTEAICSASDANLTDGHQENCTYTVWVKVEDGDGGSARKIVTITVNDVDEPPSAPGTPRVTATKDTGWSLDVTWSAPRNTGKPPISDYDIQYRKFKSGTPKDDWQDWLHADGADSTETSAKITTIGTPAVHLEPRTQYEVRVKAKNGENDSHENWSSLGRGPTGPSNSRPEFDRLDSVVELRVDENTRAGQNLGNAISASDADSNSLTYSLEGPGADSFTIVSSSGQIRTRSALDHEARESYSVTVKVDDRQKKDNSVAAKSVTITVDDVREPPPAPAAPRVVGISGSTSSVRVTWDEPANMGPPIEEYDVNYREVGSGPARWRHFGTDRNTIITGLKAGTRYEVQVRARSDEGQSEWSRWGAGMPNPDVANRVPVFSGGARTLSVAENTLPNTDIGAPIAATDRDGDTLTYALEGADAGSFDILSTSDGGQIRTSAELNFEEKASYSVTVRVADGRGGTDAVNVTIRVTDVDGEAPATPLGPTVSPVSSTSLQVSWEEPDNAGPPITDYDYRYREVSGSWTEVTNTTITGTTVTIERLSASTSYDVAVRAKNAEGASDWSSEGIGQTNDAGANNPPVFTEGASATRSVSATSAAGTSVGLPVSATDADSGDTLTYSLEGRDAPSFDINDTTGQILTRSGITLIVDEIYTLTVAAYDGTESAEISVTITATAAPPNNAPVFTEGASAARTVSASAPAGTSIGAPFTATDADAGTTLTYSLEGADAASFRINTANGQLLTVAGVTLDRTTYTVEVVANDGITSSRITVTITVTPNRAPVFSEGATATRSVREDAASGVSIGSPVRATDADPGTTLTYRLEGTDAGSFTINTANGQIRTSAALDASTKSSYTVDVVASDGSLEARITVSITVTALPASFGCATNGAVSDASNTGLVSDCEALLRSRNALEGSSRLNWSARTPIEDWDGVYRGGTPLRVTWLIIRRWGLDGTIPADLGQLDRLTILNLHSNELSGSIPAEIGDLTNLEQLLLHNNSLSGDFPDLGRLSRLKRIWFSGANNRIGEGDGIPTWLNRLTNLEELNLWGNEMGGSIPNLSGLTSLKLLKLQNNSLTGSIPSWFDRDMNSLSGLYLHNNGLTGSIPSELGELTRLRRLWLDRNDLTGSIPPQLGNMTNLGTLNLHTNRLSGSIPTQLGNLSRLQHIGFHNNALTGGIPVQLGNLSELTRLAVSNNQLSGSIPSELGDLGKLTLLWLSENQLTGTIPSALGDLGDTLTSIKLADNNFDTGACVPSGLANVSKNDYSEAGLSTCTN